MKTYDVHSPQLENKSNEEAVDSLHVDLSAEGLKIHACTLVMHI